MDKIEALRLDLIICIDKIEALQLDLIICIDKIEATTGSNYMHRYDRGTTTVSIYMYR
jgi:hypothetical protein